MKHNLRKPIKFGILFSAIMLIKTVAFGTTYTAVNSGLWTSTSTWAGGNVPTSSLLGLNSDNVIISSTYTVTLDTDYDLTGTSTLDIDGTLNSQDNHILSVTTGTLSGSGKISADSMSIMANITFSFNGSLTAKRMWASAMSLQSGTNLIINGRLTLDGELTVVSNAKLMLQSNSTIIMTGGGKVTQQNGGTLTLSSTYNVVYNNNSTTTSGNELSGSGLNNVTIDVGGSNTVALSNNLTVRGMLRLTTGTLSLSGHNLTITGNGDIALSGSGSIYSTSTSDITLSSTRNMTGVLLFSNTSTGVKNLTVNTGGNYKATLSGTVKVTGTLSVTSGVLKLQSTRLMVTGNIADSGNGTISSDIGSSVIVNTSNSPAGALRFDSSNNTVDTLWVNIGNNGYLKIDSDVNVDEELKFSAGRVNIGDKKLTLNSSASISGAGSNSYVITETGGSLGLNLTNGGSATTYPVGTQTAYFPANASLASGSSSRIVRVNVSPNVYINGTSGGDMSNSQPVVDATWDVTADVTTNLNLKLDLMWMTSSEVNGFSRSNAYISHYTNGSWDTTGVSASLSISGGLYILSRANLLSLSPYAVFDRDARAGIASVKHTATEVTVYPNPTSDNISINIADSKDEEVTIDIVDITGQIVSTHKITKKDTSIPVKELPSGSYFIKIYNNKINSVKRFTKI